MKTDYITAKERLAWADVNIFQRFWIFLTTVPKEF